MAIPKRLAHHIEMCDDEGRKVIVRVADVDDYLLALVTYNAACRRWPDAHIRLRRGTCVIEDSRRSPPV
jgi:hypothetical protein